MSVCDTAAMAAVKDQQWLVHGAVTPGDMSHVTWIRASAPCGRPSCTLRVAECVVDAGCCVLPLTCMQCVAHEISPAVFVRRYMVH